MKNVMKNLRIEIKYFLYLRKKKIKDTIKIIYLFTKLFLIITFVHSQRISKSVLLDKLKEAERKILLK